MSSKKKKSGVEGGEAIRRVAPISSDGLMSGSLGRMSLLFHLLRQTIDRSPSKAKRGLLINRGQAGGGIQMLIDMDPFKTHFLWFQFVIS